MSAATTQTGQTGSQNVLAIIRQLQPQLQALAEKAPTCVGLTKDGMPALPGKWNNWNSDDGPKSP